MPVEYRPAETLAELEQILQLQAQNLPDALTPEQRARQGFVTLRYTAEQLMAMKDHCPQVIAMEEDLLIGYALCLHPGLQQLMPELSPLFSLVEGKYPLKEGYRVMGQICIREGHRGLGHFPGLYHCLKQRVAPMPLITEISLLNTRSLKAHSRIGFRKLGRRMEGGQPWEVVIWE